MMDRPNFEAWWEEHGQYGRAGGGEYEIRTLVAARLTTPPDRKEG